MFASRSDLMVRTRPYAWIAAASFLLLLALARLLPSPASAQKTRSKAAAARSAADSIPKAASDEGISVRVVEDGKQAVKHVRTARERANAARGEAIDEADKPDTPDAPEPPDTPEDHSNDLVRFGQDIVIPAGKVIEGNVVTLGGSITVYGRVKGDCTAVGGSVRSAWTAIQI